VASAKIADASTFENQFAILRHCQLLKGKKEGDAVYIVLW